MKNNDILLDVIGDVDDKLVPELDDGNVDNKINEADKNKHKYKHDNEHSDNENYGDNNVIDKEKGSENEQNISVVLRKADHKKIKNISSGNIRKKKRKFTGIAAIAGICAAAVIACVLFLPDNPLLPGNTKKADARQLAAAKYPDMPNYPNETEMYQDNGKKYSDWMEGRKKINNQPVSYKEGFASFLKKSVGVFLNDQYSVSGNNTDKNIVYSPLGLYMVLGMTAEVTDGNSRAQILDVLGKKDIDMVRSQCGSMWLANYVDDGLAKSVIANSLWTNSNKEYKQETLDNIAKNYYASSFTGEPDTEEYDKLLHDWLNKQTDNLLKDYVSDIKMDPNMMLMLVSTINYSAEWENPFMKENTEKGIFNSSSGDMNCDYMKLYFAYMMYFEGQKFSSVTIPMKENGNMRILLPNKGTTPEELLSDDEAMACMLADQYSSSFHSQLMNLSIPKFDVSSGTDLIDGLMSLGITDVFYGDISDFKPLGDERGMYISKAEQDNRVMIDEKGCKAVSITDMGVDGAGEIVEEPVDYKVDRPFIFEILGESGLPLFIGIVNEPTASEAE